MNTARLPALVWNDVAATQLVVAAQEAQRLAEVEAEKEAAQSWARAALAAAVALEPGECDLAPYQALAAALAAVDDEQLAQEAADALAKQPPALFALAAAARGKKWEELANTIMARCLAQTGVMAGPAEFGYQTEWRQQYETQLVETLGKVWKKRATRNLSKQAVALATESEELDAQQVEENLKALLSPADLWPRPVQRRKQTRSRQSSSGRSRGGGRRSSGSSRGQRSSSRAQSTRKAEGESS